jgi:hypothetical protein
MDLRHQMSVDHANIRQLADQLLRAAGNEGARGRDNLFDQLDNEVRRHSMLVETVVIPSLADGGATPSRDHHGSHRELERLLDGLSSGDKSSTEWTARFEMFGDELDRVFGEHMQMIGTMGTRVDGRELGRAYARAKIKAIRSSGYVSRWSGRRRRIAGIGLGLGLAALAAVAWQRRSRAGATDVDRTTRNRLRFRTGMRRDQPSAAQITVVA